MQVFWKMNCQSLSQAKKKSNEGKKVRVKVIKQAKHSLHIYSAKKNNLIYKIILSSYTLQKSI